MQRPGNEHVSFSFFSDKLRGLGTRSVGLPEVIAMGGALSVSTPQAKFIEELKSWPSLKIVDLFPTVDIVSGVL